MSTRLQEINRYLQQFRQGDRDGAFFGLLEMGPEALPTLMAMYHLERDKDARALLVEVVWQNRKLATVSFLKEALDDGEPVVWKQAVDGLVSLASCTSLDVLRSARAGGASKRQVSEEFCRWIDEAVEQVELELQKA